MSDVLNLLLPLHHTAHGEFHQGLRSIGTHDYNLAEVSRWHTLGVVANHYLSFLAWSEWGFGKGGHGAIACCCCSLYAHRCVTINAEMEHSYCGRILLHPAHVYPQRIEYKRPAGSLSAPDCLSVHGQRPSHAHEKHHQESYSVHKQLF